MAKVVKMFSSGDEEMGNLEKDLWKHRRNRILRYVIIFLLGVFAVFAIRYYLDNRSFTGYSIAATTKRTDTVTTKYAPFGGRILKYSRDGVSYTDEKNSALFSITYTMKEPILALSSNAGAVADKNGNQIYIFNQEMQKRQATTLHPIKEMSISNQGIVAV